VRGIHAIRAGIHAIDGETYAIAAGIHAIDGETHAIRGGIHAIDGETRAIRGGTHAIDGEIHAIGGEIHPIGGGIHVICGRIHVIRGGIHATRGEIHPIGEGIHVIDGGIHVIGGRGTGCSVPLEVLHGALVLLGGLARLERAEVAALAGLRILLARVEPIFTRLQLADHEGCCCNSCAAARRVFRHYPTLPASAILPSSYPERAVIRPASL